MTERPLSGKTVLVTRGKEQAREFSELLMQTGAFPLEIPLISFSLPQNIESIKQVLKEVNRYDWLIFTSKNGVDFFFQLMDEAVLKEGLPKIAVVGKKTAQALKKKGFQPSVVPKEFVAEGLIEALKPLIKPKERVLLVKGNLARPALKQALEEMGANITELVVYETKLNESGKAQLIELLIKQKIDVITFTSPSTVNSFMQMLEGIEWRPLFQHCVIACIGPITKQAAEEAGIQVHICPENYTIDDMIKAMIVYFSDREE
ncbi:MAG TPA: uroporphyrinogen-III synthase [Anoxybacillus sp.]|jgi:uroporphyrinogen-III synthase|nr:uroporphyrinogen-III synthase [Anoxybacillus sp.]